MELAPDFDEFVESLIAHGVEFLVVGAYALAFHGAPRFTGDLDILIQPTLDNAERLMRALGAFGVPVNDLSAQLLVDSRRMLEMGVPPVQIHVMSAITGVEWGEAWVAKHRTRTTNGNSLGDRNRGAEMPALQEAGDAA
jgi:hypothetical protein